MVNQTSDSLTYTSDDVCNGNFPECILTRVLDFSSDGLDIILTTEEDNRLCRIANGGIREIKLDVTWSYVKRQTAKMTSEFLFFSSNPSLNHIKIEKCILLLATNTNIFTLLFKELKTNGKSFIFAVCRLTYDHVTSNLISLIKPTSSLGY